MGMFRALAHPAFRMLWASALLIQIGQWFITVTYQWVLPHESDSDAFLLGVLYFASFLPFLLFSLPAGALADNRDRRSILIISQSIALVLAAIALTLSLLDMLSAFPVLLLAFASGCVVTFVSPANHALTANTVPLEDLANAVPVQSIAINIARIAGPAIAGPILLAVGAPGAFATYAATTLIALALVSRIRAPQHFPTGSREKLVLRIRIGIAHARERRPTPAILALVAITSLFGTAFQSQLPILGARISADGDRAFIMLLVLTGVGSLIGVLWVARLRSLPSLRSIIVWLLLLGTTTAGMGLTRSYPITLALALIGGALIFIVMTSANTLIQHLVDDAQRGRVLSLYFLGWGGLLPISSITFGTVISLAGAPTALITFGAAAMLGSAAVWVRVARPTAP